MNTAVIPADIEDDLPLVHMSPAEKRGARHALRTLALWAHQIENNAHKLSHTGITIPLDMQMANSARMTKSLAQAMELSLTK